MNQMGSFLLKGVCILDKISLLKEIYEYYQVHYRIMPDGKILEYQHDSGILHDSVDEALIQWVSTLEGTNKNLFETGDVVDRYNTWTEEQISFIKSLVKSTYSLGEKVRMCVLTDSMEEHGVPSDAVLEVVKIFEPDDDGNEYYLLKYENQLYEAYGIDIEPLM